MGFINKNMNGSFNGPYVLKPQCGDALDYFIHTGNFTSVQANVFPPTKRNPKGRLLLLTRDIMVNHYGHYMGITQTPNQHFVMLFQSCEP